MKYKKSRFRLYPLTRLKRVRHSLGSWVSFLGDKIRSLNARKAESFLYLKFYEDSCFSLKKAYPTRRVRLNQWIHKIQSATTASTLASDPTKNSSC